MGRIAQRLLVAVMCIGLAVGVTACAKKTSETPSTTATEELKVADVDLGRSIDSDKHVTEKVDTFHPTDVIYASVLTTGAAASAALKARWTYEDGQLVDETVKTIAPTGDAATEFHVSKPDGWPTGKYKLEVFLNGSSVQSKDFEVK